MKDLIFWIFIIVWIDKIIELPGDLPKAIVPAESAQAKAGSRQGGLIHESKILSIQE